LGQNGFLTGGLIGLILLAIRDTRRNGGIPLGLMAMKPHLAVGLALLSLLERRWAMIAVAVATTVLTSFAATAVLGWGVWPVWLAGVAQSSGFLHDGAYSLYRMSSIYAFVRSFGASAGVAFALHIAVTLCVVGMLAYAFVRGCPRHYLLALAALANVFISPYNHDYDYVSLALGLSLVLPDLLRRMRSIELAAFYLLCWIGTGAGLAQHLRAVLFYGSLVHPRNSSLDWSIQAPAIILAAAVAGFALSNSRSSPA
jgi:hypothetical protein